MSPVARGSSALHDLTKESADLKTGSTKSETLALGGVLLLLPLLLFLAGCKGPRKRVDAHMDFLREKWATNYQHQANLPDRPVDWPAAVSLMLQNNLELMASRMDLTNAQDSVKQVWKDLIPNINLRAGMTKRLRDLHKVSPDDVTLSADSFFNLPGLVNFSARLYAAKLYQLRAETAYRLLERQQIIELFKLFYGFEEAALETTRLEMQRATSGAMETIDPFTARTMITELQTRELAHESDLNGLQDRAGVLLGNRDYRWIFLTNNLPDLRYHEAPLNLGDTNRIAQLQMRLFAVELEAARATLLGLKLRYWPELNIFISSPPLFARTFGETQWWDADELRASADIFWSIDTRGYISRAVKQTERQIELQKHRYYRQAIELINRLVFTQKFIESTEEQLARVESHLRLLLAVPPAQDYFSVEKYSLDYRSLTQQQVRLRRELSTLNTLFWFVDEDAWRHQLSAAPSSPELN